MRLVPGEVTYEEGIYVGYRYFNTFKVKPAYEFGYGMSYTTFAYNSIKVNRSTFKDKISVTLNVTNTGKVPGREVVQLYVSAPKGKLDKPAQELKGFAKTSQLEPGKSQTITFELNARDLASFDPESSSWIVEAGKYEIQLGTSSQKILQRESVMVEKLIIVEKTNKVMVPQVTISELKNP
jgi:beta-glucosidase